MVYFINILLGIVLLALSAVLFLYKQQKTESQTELERADSERKECEALGQGLAEYTQKLQEKKEQAKKRIMDLIVQNTRVSNREAADVLGVSRISVIRYLDELEAEGKAKQMGKAGQKVFYEAK